MEEQHTAMIGRILNKIGDTDLLKKLDTLSPSDLQSLMMEVFGRLTGRMTPPGLLKDYQKNRFVKPAGLDALSYLQLELKALTLAGEMGVEPVLLSPAGLLGSCSAMAAASQNKVLSSLRGTEILADPTNMLALHIAELLIKKARSNTDQPIHLCAANRVARAQIFSGPNMYSHFGIYCMVSSGRDTGSYGCEHRLLTEHLNYYIRLFQDILHLPITVILKKRGGYKDSRGFLDRTAGCIKASFPQLKVTVVDTESDNAYYLGLNFKIMLTLGGKQVEIGDGGFVDWTQKLLGSKKERMLISGIGLDRLMSMKEEQERGGDF